MYQKISEINTYKFQAKCYFSNTLNHLISFIIIIYIVMVFIYYLTSINQLLCFGNWNIVKSKLLLLLFNWASLNWNSSDKVLYYVLNEILFIYFFYYINLNEDKFVQKCNITLIYSQIYTLGIWMKQFSYLSRVR